MRRIRLNGDRARFPIEVDLDGEAYRLRFTWNDTLGAWYLDVRTANGDPIVLGQRVTPEGDLIPDRTVKGAPPGRLVATGPDPYERGDLGVSLAVFYIEASEIP